MLAALFLFSPLLSPLGIVIAALGYPWRQPVAKPFIWYIAALLLPLLLLVGLQAKFALPAGSCVDRPLNYLPYWIAGASVLLAIALSVLAKSARRFVVGAAITITPLTLFWSMVTVMGLAGCWI
jgi:hypothetical protein